MHVLLTKQHTSPGETPCRVVGSPSHGIIISLQRLPAWVALNSELCPPGLERLSEAQLRFRSVRSLYLIFLFQLKEVNKCQVGKCCRIECLLQRVSLLPGILVSQVLRPWVSLMPSSRCFCVFSRLSCYFRWGYC